MKVLTLTQPWASLVATGRKQVETRSWATQHRGPLAIHAAKGFPRAARDFASEEVALGRLSSPLPCGAVLCVIDLIACRPAQEVEGEVSALERRYGDYSWGRWAWVFDPASLRVLKRPVPAKGALGLWQLALDEPDEALAGEALADTVQEGK